MIPFDAAEVASMSRYQSTALKSRNVLTPQAQCNLASIMIYKGVDKDSHGE